MCEKLVSLSTQDVGKAIPVTNSYLISERIGDYHWKVMNLIKNNLEDFESFGRVNFESCTLETNGGKQNIEIAFLTEEHFLFLVTLFRVKKNKKTIITEKEKKMQERNKKVLELKKELVKQFYVMKKELQARAETRHISVSVRKNLTDTIKNYVKDEGNFKKFAYGNYTKLVYKKITGKTVKKLKEERNIPENKNVRDYFNIEELEKIQELESKIANFIEFCSVGKTDKEIYQEVKKYLEGDKNA